MAIKIESESREEFEKRKAATPEGQLVGHGIKISCDRDHCTPEERAVIAVAVDKRRAELTPYTKLAFILELETAERRAVDALLAARAKQEVDESGGS